VWDASDENPESPYSREKDVPSTYADRMVGEGQYEEVKPAEAGQRWGDLTLKPADDPES
jgi:hypothetical protein